MATVIDTSLSGHRVARQLDHIAEIRGHPCMVASDNGTELTSNASLKWQEERRVEWHYIAPPPLGTLLRNALPGSGCRMALSIASMAASGTSASTNIWFANLRRARGLITARRDDYNRHRPHTSLDGLTL